MSVGLSDICVVYPIAVLATRRECGIPLARALAQGRLWSGGWTAATLLVPYSAIVESGASFVDGALSNGGGGYAVAAGAGAVTTAVTGVGMQIIDKKMVSKC